MGGSSNALASKHCVPCRGGTPPLKGEELENFRGQLPDWRVVDEHHLEKSFTFPDFKSALAFVNRVGDMADEEGHHSAMSLSSSSENVTPHTQTTTRLSESVFIFCPIP